jgi:hypothetical protein
MTFIWKILISQEASAPAGSIPKTLVFGMDPAMDRAICFGRAAAMKKRVGIYLRVSTDGQIPLEASRIDRSNAEISRRFLIVSAE